MTNIIHALFGKKKLHPARGRDISSLAKGLSTPAIQVLKQDIPSRSHFGGTPNLPDGIAWPERNGRKLAFLARISLQEIQHSLRVDWLPEIGALLFFYDMDEQPWGFDPEDRGSWSVLFVPESAADASTIHFADRASERDSPVAGTYAGFRRIESFPSYERDAVADLALDDNEAEKYGALTDQTFHGEPRHQISGFPQPVQGDGMELECQLASNGLYCGDSTGYQDARATALKAGAANWRLLFQFDSDDDLSAMWGDCGMLYFWIEEHAARAGEFGNTWLVLQCY